MFSHRRVRVLCLVLAASLFPLVSCSPPQPTATPIPPTETPVPPAETFVPPTETPVPPIAAAQAVDAGIEVTFDGSECIVSGPTELPVGEYHFVLENLRKPHYLLYMARFVDGKTFQDLLDLQSEPGEYVPYDSRSSWFVETINTVEWNESNSTYVYTFFLDKEGEYYIQLGRSVSQDLWYCGSLMVTEVPSD